MKKMIVIQCAGKKDKNAGYLQTLDGQNVMFVGDPQSAPSTGYAHPDGPSDRTTGESWRDILEKYNEEYQKSGKNPYGLLPAWRLYRNPSYGELKKYCESKNHELYILSAGWGLIPSDYLTPQYDITFGQVDQSEKFKKRKKKDSYRDRSLPSDLTGSIMFFGGKSYIDLFCELTAEVQSRYVWYRKGTSGEPYIPNCKPIPYETSTKTNWHYECVNAFIEGRIRVEEW